MRCRITSRPCDPRAPGYRPEGDENKHNAWYVKTTIKGAPSGKLAGKTIALKDNVSLAGVPMMNGASTLEEGYVPTTDATIVTRKQLRPAADANFADEGDAIAAARCAARTVYSACLRDGAQHGALQRIGASGDEHPLAG